MAKQFTKASLAMSFFGSSSYERFCVRSCYRLRKNTSKIPVNTGNFTKKKLLFQTFLAILFSV